MSRFPHIILLLLVFLCQGGVLFAQDYRNWAQQATRLPDSYFTSDRVREDAERVLSSQLPSGGWPKNVNFFVTQEEHPDDVNLGTIDNGATLTEVRYLMRLYEINSAALPKKTEKSEYKRLTSYRDAALRGIAYLLKMQYSNGGFPQYYPRTDHYHALITYNDNAMVGAMRLLRDVYLGVSPYSTVSGDIKERCGKAYWKGVSCILRTQIFVDGHPTVWCQQHDPVTLEPKPARGFELAAFVSAESLSILELLHDEALRLNELIKNQTTDDKCISQNYKNSKLDYSEFNNFVFRQRLDSINRSLNGAVSWLENHVIYGYQRVNFIDAEGNNDYRMEPCAKCQAVNSPLSQCQHLPRQWARFYDLEMAKPVFCGRDTIPHDRVEDIEHERRNGYAWFVGYKNLSQYLNK